MTRAPYRFGHPKPDACFHGHAYTPENTKVVTNDTGRSQRRCRTCERAAGRASKARKRLARKVAT
jgi:hypothetical protein